MKLHRRLMLLPALLGLALVSGCAGVTDFSPDGRRLVFTWTDKLMIANVDGSGLTAVPSAEGAEFPTWSPDGSHIVFARKDGDHQNLHLVDLTTRKAKKLFQNATGPYAWREDGKRLWAVATGEGGEQEIVQLSVPDGEIVERAGLKNVTLRLGFETRMILVPGTERVAFVGEKAKDKPDLYLMEGGEARPLTGTHDVIAAGLGRDRRSLLWLRGWGQKPTGEVSLHSMDLVTRAVTTVRLPAPNRATPTRPGFRYAGIGFGTFSADGKQLAVLNLYEAARDRSAQKRSYMECSTTSVSNPAWRLVQQGRAGKEGGELLIPVWSQDGRRLAIISASDQRASIRVFTDGKGGRPLINTKGDKRAENELFWRSSAPSSFRAL